MINGDDEEKLRKVNEYWNILPLFSSIRHSEKLHRLLGAVKNLNDPQWTPYKYLLMTDEQISRIRAMYSKNDRKKLEETWSFVGISRWFADSEEPGLNSLAYFDHGYGMSSHLLHKDADGVGMVWERYGRASERQNAIKMGHSARVVSDICTFAQLRLFSLLRATRQETAFITDLTEEFRPLLFDELSKASLHFTQTEHGKQT